METKEYITARSFAIKALLAVISGKKKRGSLLNGVGG